MFLLVLILSVITTAYLTYLAAKDLFQWFPFGSRVRFWWFKYIPLFAFSFFLIILGTPGIRPIFGAIPILVIFASRFIGEAIKNRREKTKVSEAA